MTDVTVVIDSTGAVVTPTATIIANITAYAEAASPGYTGNLPGTLIEDHLSTSVGAVALIDQARVDLVNSVGPYSANMPMVLQIARAQGFTQGTATNTSAYVVFTGTVGYYIAAGTVVSDSTYQYVTQEAVTVPTGGVTGQVYVVASVTGSWAVAAGTITTIISSVPSTITLTVTNSSAGTPETDAETDVAFRARVVSGQAAPMRGVSGYLRSAQGDVAGVQSRLVAVASSTSGLMVLVGGGDPYSVAGAIYNSILDPSRLIGSTNEIGSISQASPAVVVFDMPHGLAADETVTFQNCEGMTAINGKSAAATIVDNYTISVPIDTTAMSAYTGGGSLTQNPRNVPTTVIDGTDSYTIPVVVPLEHVVHMTIEWTSISTNTISSGSVSAAAIAALVTYVNELQVGQPLNYREIRDAFAVAVEDILPSRYLSALTVSVAVDGYSVTLIEGTDLYTYDPQGYYYADTTSFTISEAS